MKTASYSCELPPGVVGCLLDEVPILTTAHVRPYVIATLLHRGAVRDIEIIAALTPHCNTSDLKTGEWDPFDDDYCDQTRVEKLVHEVLGEFVADGILRYNEEHQLWVLTTKHVSTVISWASCLGARIPQHMLLEMSKQQSNKSFNYGSI